MNTPVLKSTAAALILATSFTGCANIQNDQTRTKTEGTLIGSSIGAVIGGGIAAIATRGDKSAILKGAAIGAAAGGLLGHAYGSKVAARKAEYADNESYLQGCIAELRSERTRVAASNEQTRKTIASQKQELNQLIALQKNNEPTRERFVALNRSVDSSLKVANDNLKRTDALIQDHETAVKNPENSDVAKGSWKSELANLKAERAELQASINSLNAIETSSKQMLAQAR
ncbi:MAG: hypothetical protein WCH57_01360 [Verrucomicrobiota bacterium]